MYADPDGNVAITLSIICMSMAVGAGIGFASAAYSDYKEDGKWFNGDWTDYFGKILGGAIAGAGIGFASTLGAGLGAAMLASESLSVAGIAVSGSAALSIAAIGSFATGMVGYAARAGISRSESFDVSDMFIEGTANMASGLLSFVGGFCGGAMGVKIPGKWSIKNFLIFQTVSSYFGVLPMKVLISKIKNNMEEIN